MGAAASSRPMAAEAARPMSLDAEAAEPRKLADRRQVFVRTVPFVVSHCEPPMLVSMVTVDEQGRLEPPIAAGELDSIRGFLDYQRATLEWKCRGLDAAGLRATTAASTMTLGGLLKHMAWVEDAWFSVRLHGNMPSAEWRDVDWEADEDWEWHSAADDTPEQLLSLWESSVERSRERVAEAVSDGGLDTLAAKPWPDGTAPNLRWIILHMIEEYARHNGHADVLRESVDGETGE